ncbi:MAG: VCBS repeat-containing protein [Planctomycetota bacterium]
MEPGLPTFLAGDHNCPSHLDWVAANANQNFGVSVPWPVSMALEAAGFRDMYREVHSDPSQERGFTWSPGYPKGRLELDEVHDRIDMIYFRPGGGQPYSAIQAYTMDESPWPSDHGAVVASVLAASQTASECPVFLTAVHTPHGSSGWGGTQTRMVDVNGDKNVDYVFPSDNNIWVRLSNGDGTFQGVISNPHGGTGWAGSEARMADVSGDGNADFVYTDDSALYVRISNGDGTFQTVVQDAHIGSGWGGTGAMLADVNGDDDVDYVYSADRDLWVRLSNGDGTFQAAIQNPHVGSPWSGTNSKMADVNGDKNADFVYTGSEALFVRLSNGDGTFQTVVTSSHVGSGWGGTSVRLADVNGDKNVDWVFASDVDIWVRLSNDDGTFQSVIRNPHEGTGWFGPGTKMADVNGDGSADYVYTGLDTLYVRLSSSDGTFAAAHEYPHIGSGWNDAMMADINGDGRADYVHAGDSLLSVRLSATAAALPYGTGKAGTMGIPVLSTVVAPAAGATADLTITNGRAGDVPVLFLGATQVSLPFDGGTLLVQPLVVLPMLTFDSTGTSSLPLSVPSGSFCASLFWQALFVDNGSGATGALRTAQTNGLQWLIGG